MTNNIIEFPESKEDKQRAKIRVEATEGICNALINYANQCDEEDFIELIKEFNVILASGFASTIDIIVEEQT